ncbi:putative leucine-rich repeat domain superfamily [Helianthus debilis subsp. tardiflorus]
MYFIISIDDRLKSLKALDVSNNLLNEIPEEVGSATALIKFDCSGNQIKDLPCSLGNCLDLSDLKVWLYSAMCFKIYAYELRLMYYLILQFVCAYRHQTIASPVCQKNLAIVQKCQS